MSDAGGYAGNILRVDLSSGDVSRVPTSTYAQQFIGGRGIAARIYWEEVPPQTGPFDPGNRLLFFTGPLAGFTGLAASRWQVCGKSPITDREHFCYSNLGGSWGAQLKFAGYDGLIVQGRAERPAYLKIEDDSVEIRDAAELWGKGAARVRDMLKAEHGSSMRVLACGPAGDNMVCFASLLADNDASGSSGFGAVMGSKNLKAIAVRGSGTVAAAHPERLRQLATHLRGLKDGQAESNAMLPKSSKKRQEACFGCIRGCSRYSFETSDGSRGKAMCQSGIFYVERARRFYGDANEVPFHATRLCDDYGLDTNALETIIMWLSRCHQAGVLDDAGTGLPLSRMGSQEFIEALVQSIALRQGFGEVLAGGITRAAAAVGKAGQEMVTDYALKAGQSSHYEARMYITSGLLYAMEPRQPIQQLHEITRLVLPWVRWANGRGGHLSTEVLQAMARRLWGSEAAADFSTYEGKALAALRIQDRQYVKESLILCDFSWPIMYVENSADHLGDPTLESRLFSAVTGQEVEEEGLYRAGERVFNLQRAILAREGHRGREADRLPEQFFSMPLKTAFSNPECQAPGRDGELISRRGAVVERDKFEQMKTEYYSLRGWDAATGLQRRSGLEALGLADVAADLAERGLVV